MNADLRLLLIAIACLAASAHASAPVLPKGQRADLADESAVIIWDENAKTQHFILRTVFVTDAPAMAFLVPTPVKPTVVAADDDAFKKLEEMTKPRVVRREIPREFRGGKRMSHPAPAVKSTIDPPPDVKLLGEGRVGHLEYKVVQADETEALLKWLKDRGFEVQADLRPWLAHYVRKKWVVTAFKYEKKDAGHRGIASTAVRLSFPTDAPFHPYSEPKDPDLPGAPRFPGDGLSAPRFLRVHFLASTRVMGVFESTTLWGAQIPWCNPIGVVDGNELLTKLKLPATTLPEQTWLTEFEDRMPVRGSEDVFFVPDRSMLRVERPQVIDYVEAAPPRRPEPVRALGIVGGATGLILVLLLAAALLAWRERSPVRAA